MRGSSRREVGQYANCAGSGSPGGICKTLSQASSPLLICGAAIARGNGWNEAVAFAEALGAHVGRAGFRTHAVSGEPLALLRRIALRHPPAERETERPRRGAGHRRSSVSLLSLRARPVSAGGTTPTAHFRRPGGDGPGAGRRQSHRGRSPDSCRPHGSDGGLQTEGRQAGRESGAPNGAPSAQRRNAIK